MNRLCPRSASLNPQVLTHSSGCRSPTWARDKAPCWVGAMQALMLCGARRCSRAGLQHPTLGLHPAALPVGTTAHGFSVVIAVCLLQLCWNGMFWNMDALFVRIRMASFNCISVSVQVFLEALGMLPVGMCMAGGARHWSSSHASVLTNDVCKEA